MSTYHIAAIVMLFANLGCRTSPHSNSTDSVDTDPGECPGELSEDAFLESEIARLCNFDGSCPDRTDFDQQECEDGLRSFFGISGCFDGCLAAQCVAWLDGDPVCTSSEGALDESCTQAFECQEG